MTRSFEDLIAWQKAHEFVVCVYRATATFPQNESFGLTSHYINEEVRQELQFSLYNCSKFLNSYCQGVINNNATTN